MMVLVTYDVKTSSETGAKRLRQVAKICVDYGQRVQNSVFECNVDPSQFVQMKTKLLDIMDENDDSLRLYHLGANWKPKIEHFGAKEGYDPEGVIII